MGALEVTCGEFLMGFVNLGARERWALDREGME